MIKSLFELDGWALYKSSTEISSINMYGVHLTCRPSNPEGMNKNFPMSDFSWLPEEPPKCWNCNIEVPDEIQAIMHLHEWGTND